MNKILLVLAFLCTITFSYSQTTQPEVDTTLFFERGVEKDTLGKVEFLWHRNFRFSNIFYGMGYLVVENAVLVNARGDIKKSPKYYWIESMFGDKYYFHNLQVGNNTITSNPNVFKKLVRRGFRGYFNKGVNIIHSFSAKDWQ